jgi:hypothetical protein
LYFREGPRSSTWNVELPPGRFRVHASAEPTFGCVISRPLPRAPHLPATLEIELLPDAEETFVLELGAAGQLDFESLGRGPAPGEVDERLFDDDPQGSSDDTRTRVGGTWMRLYDEAGAKIADLGPFEVPGLRAGAAGLFGIDWLVRGWPARCLAPLPVGRWTLRAENEHGVVFEREITIEEGQVTTVRW